MKSLRFSAALIAGKLGTAFCRVFSPKRGSNFPGALALRLDPLFLRRLEGPGPGKTIFVTGSNGKSTSSSAIVWAFKTAGRSVCANPEGANMKAGIVSALIRDVTIGGRVKKDFIILEVDERSLAAISGDLPPGHLCVTNIQKDQVQRNGDPDYIYRMIKAVVSGLEQLTLYVNNEEPRSKSLEKHIREGSRVKSFGVAPNVRATETEKDWGISMPCPVCRDALVFSYYNLSCVGAFHCPSCGFASNARADTYVTDVDYENESFHISRTGTDQTDIKNNNYRLVYPAAVFLYNYALCACVCAEFGINDDALGRAFETFTNVGGRMETFTHAGKRIRYTRIKQENPETLQNALDTIANDRDEKVLAIGPAVVDDIIPHYSNTFYTFDCSFDPLIRSGVERFICFGSTISYDMANRLRYAGVPDEKIDVLDTDDDDKVLDAIASVQSDNIFLITWLKKYAQLKGRAK